MTYLCQVTTTTILNVLLSDPYLAPQHLWSNPEYQG